MTNSSSNTGASIKVLSAQLANQIAAGEVVERPASVVKELVENSLDAEATRIHIEIDQGGQKRILIRDDGKGIVKDELRLALSRHATSKISDINDLENIVSMGFRGEALASISSVSRLQLTSKPSEQSEAWQACAEGPNMEVQVLPAAHPDGTSIEVLDLFFNTPARRKFLRSGKTELQHIENIVKRLALTRKDVQFTLVHNNKQIFKYMACNNLAKRVEQVCGKSILEGAVPVDYSFENIRIKGWCSGLGVGGATRDNQYTFVNGRMMRDKLLSHAIRQAFEDTLAPQTFPNYVLFVSVPADQIDVNVHPAKHEVRFHQARKVHDIVFKAITDAQSASFHAEQSMNEGDAKNASKPQILEPTEALHNYGNHDYIQPLEQATRQGYSNEAREALPFPSARTQSIGQARFSPYRGESVSAAEKQANHDFYQSVHNQSEGNDSSPKNSRTNTHTDLNTSTLNASSCALLQNQLIFIQGDELKSLHLQCILSAYLQERMDQSSASQPLLMPVSIGQNEKWKKSDLENVCECLLAIGVLVDAKSQKVILKQVPSTLRQLPWSGVFPAVFEGLVSNKDLLSNENFSRLFCDELASAWLKLLPHLQNSESANSNSTMIETVNIWLSELSSHSVNVLLKEHIVSVSIGDKILPLLRAQ